MMVFEGEGGIEWREGALSKRRMGVSSPYGEVICGDLCMLGSRPVTGSVCSTPCSRNLAVGTGLCAPCGQSSGNSLLVRFA
ncbi:unnamed protein product [Rangifer tarandus platyrhynchus]|uniref:Uncharacterized protein n=2 Tax=Rangifer tarandus platyrhynchus TaxID=3082113 RepID=A0ACB0ET64_RANTA|nr:unnamed protein product [Rangifer tarandus platyrhynchus]CAI9703473.1 unnamed protein product [Rangifer tarandus platyrhynchus]